MLKGAPRFSENEKKIIVMMLAFHALEKSIIKKYKLRSLGRIKRLIKKKWKKVLPLISGSNLIIQKGADPKDVKRAHDILILYTRLYSDIIDESTQRNCKECILKLKTLKGLPSLKEEFDLEIERIVAIKPGPKKDKIVRREEFVHKEFPHLNTEVRGRLVKYFKKKLKEQEPLVMLDPNLQMRVDNFVRKHVDRIIDVCLEHAYKGIQYGYLARTTEKLSTYVDKKSRDSIDWTIASGVLIEEVAKSLS
jgi:hypothetical protein